jgi:hypothetical protein
MANSVRGNAAEADVDWPAQRVRQRYRLQRRAEQVVGDADDAERDADGHQHLGQLRGAVDAPIEQLLQRQGDDHRSRHRQQHGDPVTEAEIAGCIGRDVAADHREGAVRQVDHLHQAHRHRQADRDDEQDHAVGQGVGSDAEQGLHRRTRPERAAAYFAASPGSGCFSKVWISLL